MTAIPILVVEPNGDPVTDPSTLGADLPELYPTAEYPLRYRLLESGAHGLELYLSRALSLEVLRRLVECNDMTALIEAGMDALRL